MDKVLNIQQLTDCLSEIKSKSTSYVSNLFLDSGKDQLWIDKGLLYIEKIAGTVFIIRDHQSFWNVYFAAPSLETLLTAAETLKREYDRTTMVMDIVGRKNDCLQIQSALENAHWQQYTSLVRMSHFGAPEFQIATEPSDQKEVSYGTIDDAPAVQDLLKTYFDPLAEQIPTLEELQTFARNSQILICRRDGKRAGFLIFEKSTQSLYLRYWFVHPDYRELKVGSQLLRHFLHEGSSTRRQQLWVIQTNENAIKRYRHYGFSEENLYDIILTNKNIQYSQS